jgi:signal transduction histidine kinase
MGNEAPRSRRSWTDKLTTSNLIDASILERAVTYRPFPQPEMDPSELDRSAWRVRFDPVSDPGESFGLDINGDILFGRGSKPDNLIDLTPYNATEMGVSRLHAKMHPTATALYVADVGSTNGTYRNGQPIGVNTPYSISNGDTLTFGRLQFVVRIIKRPAGHTSALRQKADLADALSQVAKAISSQVELDAVLRQVSEAVMNLTLAAEAGIWLVDDLTGELLPAAQYTFENERFQEMETAATDEALVRKVISTGEPVRVGRQPGEEKIKVKTNYLVEALIYVPISLGGVAFGVLSAAHRERDMAFSERDEHLLSTIADFAAIAIQNVRLYSQSEADRSLLFLILQQVNDPILVIDEEDRLILGNYAAMPFLDKIDQNVNPIGMKLGELTGSQSLQELAEQARTSEVLQGEVQLSNEKVFNTHINRITGVGRAIVMQDISNLKEIDRAKTEVIEMVSHQVRSPLTAILAYVELLGRTGELNPNQLEFAKQVSSSVQLITDTINDLLDLGKIESGLDHQCEPVDIVETLQYVYDKLRDQAEAKQINFDLKINGSARRVQGNPVRLRQAFINLADNAIKYTPHQGEVSVTLDNEEDQIVIRVRDTGIGIALKDQPRIFDKFFRAEDVSGRFEGTGLGLSIVKTIIESHEGRIWVDSVDGKGTTFTVVLPAVDAQ